MRKSIYLFIVALMVMSIQLSSLTYEEFPLGCYSYMRNNESASGTFYNSTNNGIISNFINGMGYNSTVIDIRNTEANLLQTLRNNALDAIVIDYASPYSTLPLTTSNYFRFEAEFIDEDSDNMIASTDIEEEYWYSSRDETTGRNMPRVGSAFADINIQPNINLWQCLKGADNPGFAYTDLRWRWLNTSNNQYTRINEQFRFNKVNDFTGSDYASSYYLNNSYLYIRYSFKLQNVDPSAANSANLLEFYVMGYPPHSLGYTADTTTVTHYYNGNSRPITFFTKQDYNANPNNYVTLELKIKYIDLFNAGLITDHFDLKLTGEVSYWAYLLTSLNPRVYWHGNCDLYLDYIELEDQLHKDIVDNTTSYATNVNARLQELRNMANGNIIKHVLSFDEPLQGQFDSYQKVQNMIQSDKPQMATACYDSKYKQYNMGQGKFYDHLKAFRKVSQPQIIMPDMYPIRPEYNWNDENSNLNSIQRALDDKLLIKYKEAKQYCKADNSGSKKFIPIPQTFGNWACANDNNDGVMVPHWKSWILPPYNMQKCLKYLPLCYGADGMVDFCVLGRTTNGYRYNAALMSDNNSTPTNNTFTCQAITEANSKIKFYAEELIKLNWLNADSIMTSGNHPEINLASVYLDELKVVPFDPPTPPPPGFEQYYEGYVQCGYYSNTCGNPSFMLVNRRTNYFKPSTTYNSPYFVPKEFYDTHFRTAANQTVRFTPDSNAYTNIGTHLTLFDSQNNTFYNKSGTHQYIDVPIGPGDGKLLQMVGTLPSTVSANASILKTGYVQGNVTITDNANVTFDTNSDVTILPNTTITINQGSTLIIKGHLKVLENSSICANGGNLVIQDADCKFAHESIIMVECENYNGEDGIITVSNSTLDKIDGESYWKGIRVDRANNVIISNSNIRNAVAGIVSSNSNLHIYNVRFDIPHVVNNEFGNDSYGMFVVNSPSSGRKTYISGDNNDYGFFGDSQSPSEATMSYGLYINGHSDSLYISNQVFHNLHYGIYTQNSLERGNNIFSCQFSNCVEGIHLISNDRCGTISYCDFYGINSDNEMTGIHMLNSAPDINNCQFINCNNIGIFAENITYTGHHGIEECIFTNCSVAIAGRNASNEIKNCSFDYNQHGILCYDGANFCLTPNAYNQFGNLKYNIAFVDTSPYLASIQIEGGHNDFAHLYNEDTSTTASDFFFDQNYTITENHIAINGDYNWYQDYELRVLLEDNQADPSIYVTVDEYDIEPHVQIASMAGNRYFVALQYECDELYEQADNLYHAILNDPIDGEKEYLSSCADGIYRIALYMNYPISESINYFDDMVLQYAVSDPYLSKLLESYLLKELILGQEYQEAIDLIQPRIDNPISEIDSLRAVLDIEIILQLASYSNSKKPILVACPQYKYPNTQTFTKMHNKHWIEYIKLLDEQKDDAIPIPPVATLYQNYPNPFNPSTTISFALPKETPVKVSMYNIKGQMVKQLCNKTMPKGQHKLVWDGKNEHGKSAASGIYLIRLETNDKVVTKKAMMLK